MSLTAAPVTGKRQQNDGFTGKTPGFGKTVAL